MWKCFSLNPSTERGRREPSATLHCLGGNQLHLHSDCQVHQVLNTSYHSAHLCYWDLEQHTLSESWIAKDSDVFFQCYKIQKSNKARYDEKSEHSTGDGYSMSQSICETDLGDECQKHCYSYLDLKTNSVPSIF